jgi:hypothetical protein
MANGSDQAAATGLAGGAIAIELLETLFDKGVLSLDDSRGILERAMKSLGPVMQSPNGLHAARIIGALQTGKFSARR